MTLDKLRAKAEAAKAWRPGVYCREDGNCNHGDHLVVFNCGASDCDACLGAQRAAKEIEIDVSRAIGFAERGADRLANGPAFHAAMIASFFCSEPNPVSEFRDAVKEMCK